MSKTVRLFIGIDYLNFIINDLTSGAAIRDNLILSRSTISVQKYFVYGNGPQLSTKKSFAYFTSENQTSATQSISSNFGQLLNQKPNDVTYQTGGSQSRASRVSTQNSAVYTFDRRTFN